jgi:hypothetical protein
MLAPLYWSLLLSRLRDVEEVLTKWQRATGGAGRALGLRLEAAAEPAGLVANLDDLDPPQLWKDAAAQPEQLAAAQPGADLGEEVVAVERAAGGQEAAELLRGERACSGTPQQTRSYAARRAWRG